MCGTVGDAVNISPNAPEWLGLCEDEEEVQDDMVTQYAGRTDVWFRILKRYKCSLHEGTGTSNAECGIHSSEEDAAAEAAQGQGQGQNTSRSNTNNNTLLQAKFGRNNGKITSTRASIEPETRIVQEQRDKKQQERRRTTTRNSTKLNRLGGLAGCHLKLRNCYFLMSKLQAGSRLSTLSRFISPTMLDILVSSSILGILTNYSKRRPVARTPPDWSYTDICGPTILAWPRSCSRLP